MDVAEDVAILPLLAAAPEIVLLAEAENVAIESGARAYFSMGALMGLDRLRALAADIVSADHWDRLALRRIVDDLFTAQRLLSAEALRRAREAGDKGQADGGEAQALVEGDLVVRLGFGHWSIVAGRHGDRDGDGPDRRDRQSLHPGGHAGGQGRLHPGRLGAQ